MSHTLSNKKFVSGIGHHSLANSGKLKEIIDNKQYAQYGLTEQEAIMMLRELREGILQASLYNALTGTANTGIRNNNWVNKRGLGTKSINTWMLPFSYTEQLNRRATWLTAYRLENKRALAMGMSETEASNHANKFAVKIVNQSQGNYNQYNRPAWARGDFFQYMYIYKTFPIITVQMLRNMSPGGRLGFLAILFLAAGLKGLPFGEDLMDLIDTLARLTNIKMASIELEATKMVDATFGEVFGRPASRYVMRGVLDDITGGTISTRVGLGNLIPGSGFLRKGSTKADHWKELVEFAGPVFSVTLALGSTAIDITRYTGEVVGIKPDVTSFTDIIRKSPISAMRAWADGYKYIDDGYLTNAQGKRISTQQATTKQIVARMLGLYTAIATQQNDIVRMFKHVGKYKTQVTKEFVEKGVKYRLERNSKGLRELKRQVREWNRATKGTEMEITNFNDRLDRSYNEWRKSTISRFVKTSPITIRPELRKVLIMWGINPNEIEG